MFADLDRALREMGTGDLSVGTQVKRMARGFYGRIRAYQDGLESDDRALRAALERNLYGTLRESAPWVGAMAALCARGGCRAGPPTGGGPAVRPGLLSARRGRGARGRGRVAIVAAAGAR